MNSEYRLEFSKFGFAICRKASGSGKTTPQLQSPSNASGGTMSDEEKRKIIEEESKQLEHYEKVRKLFISLTAATPCM